MDVSVHLCFDNNLSQLFNEHSGETLGIERFRPPTSESLPNNNPFSGTVDNSLTWLICPLMGIASSPRFRSTVASRRVESQVRVNTMHVAPASSFIK